MATSASETLPMSALTPRYFRRLLARNFVVTLPDETRRLLTLSEVVLHAARELAGERVAFSLIFSCADSRDEQPICQGCYHMENPDAQGMDLFLTPLHSSTAIRFYQAVFT